jgi:hypothetical protein
MTTRPQRKPEGTYISATALADFVAGHARQRLSSNLPAPHAAARGRADHKEHHRHARRFR